MKVSLVATVKDAGDAIHDFLASVRGQTRPPDETVVVDGGSTDGVTLRALEAARDIRLISAPGANIATGRNIAIREAENDVTAVTDADCVLAPEWLELLMRPIESGAEVSAGFYLPLAGSFFQTCAAAVSVKERDEVGSRWMPSSRSVAFTRDAFERAGGYPEWLDIGEDMYLDHRLVEGGSRVEQALEAVAYWRIRPTLAATWRQYAGYAEGDARAAMHARRHALRFATYCAALAALRSGRPRAIAAAGVGAVAHAYRPLRRAWRRLPESPSERWAALVAVPALVAFVDGAKMWGYLRGRVRARR